MKLSITPARQAAAGATILMACACGAGANSATLLNMCNINATPKLTQSLILGAGALFMLRGCWQMHRRAALVAATSLVVLAAAATLTPPSVMSSAYEPWAALHVEGAVLYLIFAALLIAAFWIAFPQFSPRWAKATAFTGTAVATGCGCCMVTGALTGLGVTFAGGPALFPGAMYLMGIAIAAVGLVFLGGMRSLAWLLSGALVTHFHSAILALLGTWTINNLNFTFIPGYILYLLGAALIVKAWAVACDTVSQSEPLPIPTPQPAF